MPRRPRKPRRLAESPIELTLDGLGAQGDATGVWNGKRVFVPFALPGEKVVVRPRESSRDDIRADLDSILDPSSERVMPPCPHFGRCGGCALQHWSPEATAAWKRNRVVGALSQRGMTEITVEPTVAIAPGTRRRATFAFRHGTLGFNARASNRIENLHECPLLAPAIIALLPALRGLLPALATVGDVHVTLSESGLDLWIDLPDIPGLDALERLAAFAETHDLARIGWRAGDIATPAAERRTPTLTIGDAVVALPPRAFLQPSPEGESALAERALAAIGDATSVIDLFCGLGTFALRLASRGKVLAIDGDAALTGALNATRRATVETRDLFQRPLQPSEMKGYAAALFDPPRAGAREQAATLAGSDLETIVAVSCNPTTFARDARILVDGGYLLEWVMPVDQFPWSGHVELVARFIRA